MLENKIRVLLVEDSIVEQKLLKSLILSDKMLDLVAIASNGKEAVSLVEKFKPDVVSMDIMMPVMDGIEATKQIMQKYPVPIIIVSSIYQSTNIELAIRELEAGAVTIIPKPFGIGHPKFEYSVKKYLNTIKLMSEIKVVRRRNNPEQTLDAKIIPNLNMSELNAGKDFEIIVLGASAGGPDGIRTILSTVSSKIPVPMVIIQHIDSNFTEGFCNWLNTVSNIPVKICSDYEKLLPGTAYLPPSCKNIYFKNKNYVSVKTEPQPTGIVPSIDVLFFSTANIYKNKAIAILLSGMGKDGAKGLKELRDNHSYTFAQDENSSLIFGMNGEAVKLGAACQIESPEIIGIQINKIFNL